MLQRQLLETGIGVYVVADMVRIVKRISHVAIAAAVLLAPIAQAKVCTPKDATAADALVDHLTSWAKVREAFTKYGHCDDGQIAEGNSEAVARLLVDHWESLPSLVSMFKDDPSFKAFVVRHIDTTLNTDDIDKIRAAASSSCPSGMESFCQELVGAASQAAPPAKR